MEERLENALIQFVEGYSKTAKTAEEVEALAAVARVLKEICIELP